MARVTYINAIYSGKLGGAVYANNKAGPYARVYAKPTNANTSVQNAARTNFGASTQAWHSLTDAEKAQWASFAENVFKPKGLTSGVVYSGFNAFVSLNNVCRNANAATRTTDLEDDTGTSMTPTFDVYSFNNSPPASSISPDITLSGGGSNQVRVIDGALDEDGTGSVRLELNTADTNPSWVDPTSGEKIGYTIFMSNQLIQENQYVLKPNLAIIGNTGVLAGQSAAASASAYIDIVFTATDLNIAGRKWWPSVGSTVYLEVWATSQSGQLAALNRVPVVVT